MIFFVIILVVGVLWFISCTYQSSKENQLANFLFAYVRDLTRECKDFKILKDSIINNYPALHTTTEDDTIKWNVPTLPGFGFSAKAWSDKNYTLHVRGYNISNQKKYFGFALSVNIWCKPNLEGSYVPPWILYAEDSMFGCKATTQAIILVQHLKKVLDCLGISTVQE